MRARALRFVGISASELKKEVPTQIKLPSTALTICFCVSSALCILVMLAHAFLKTVVLSHIRMWRTLMLVLQLLNIIHSIISLRSRQIYF